MTCTGILGEYIARIYHEVKRRPRYIIESDGIERKSAGRTIPSDEQLPTA
jgi:hypothetical protein